MPDPDAPSHGRAKPPCNRKKASPAMALARLAPYESPAGSDYQRAGSGRAEEELVHLSWNSISTSSPSRASASLRSFATNSEVEYIFSTSLSGFSPIHPPLFANARPLRSLKGQRAPAKSDRVDAGVLQTGWCAIFSRFATFVRPIFAEHLLLMLPADVVI